MRALQAACRIFRSVRYVALSHFRCAAGASGGWEEVSPPGYAGREDFLNRGPLGLRQSRIAPKPPARVMRKEPAVSIRRVSHSF